MYFRKVHEGIGVKPYTLYGGPMSETIRQFSLQKLTAHVLPARYHKVIFGQSSRVFIKYKRGE